MLQNTIKYWVGIFFLLSFILIPDWVQAASSQLKLTEDEREYIRAHPNVHVALIDDVAPLEYFDSQGQPRGIAVELYKKISELTGLNFVYHKKPPGLDADLLREKGLDLLQAVPSQYLEGAFKGLSASPSYLTCKAVLYIRKDVDPENLENKIFAGNYGRNLPEGVNEKNVKYYWGRNDALKGVNDGEADYGYGNEYSVSFNVVQHHYRNLVIIPTKTDTREYLSIYINEDPRLHSILNKAISSISQRDMQSIVLLGCMQMEQNISFMKVLETYMIEFTLTLAFVTLILTLCTIKTLKTSRILKMQNQRLFMLAEISSEYIYEYDFNKDKLLLSKSCQELFDKVVEITRYDAQPQNKQSPQSKPLAEQLKDFLRNTQKEQKIIFRLNDQLTGIFKITNTATYDENYEPQYIVGKLTDISREVQERDQLLKKSQLDSMTKIYNSQTVKTLAKLRYETRDISKSCAVAIIDIDKFKSINDTYGHIVGDEVIITVANIIREHFRNDDLVGRVGGDEFMVYMQGAFSQPELEHRLHELYKRIHTNALMRKYQSTLSIGCLFIAAEQPSDDMDFVNIYKAADENLYQAKESGRDNYKLTSYPQAQQ